MKSKSEPQHGGDKPLEPGSRVIVRQNPHDLRSENVVGTVIALRLGEGFAGCDLIDVCYQSAADGKEYCRPFSISCLSPANPRELVSLANHFERRAAKLR